jgi:hypothetical protein
MEDLSEGCIAPVLLYTALPKVFLVTNAKPGLDPNQPLVARHSLFNRG